jgi:capsule polysaccharide export protein KpsC/LpsZ
MFTLRSSAPPESRHEEQDVIVVARQIADDASVDVGHAERRRIVELRQVRAVEVDA